MIEFCVCKNDNYFIEIKETRNGKLKMSLVFDSEVSEFLNMNIIKYKEKMKNEFNAIEYDNGQIFFSNKKDISRAIEWLQSLYLMNKLT